ncbi:MAG TPA: type II secretion system F family protein, partial [Bacteroidia bacterium]|nr:type II secretion system F family protein [Bacteroidia bacterium]
MARLSAKSKGLIYSNLAKYARSGMGMDKACESLLRQPGVAAVERRLYAGLLDGLQAGRSIADALGDAGAFVSPLEHEVIAASESGGQLEAGFAHLADYFRRLDRTRRKITKGLAYPLVLLHLAIPVSTLAVAAFGSFRLDEAFDFVGVLSRSGVTMLCAWGGILLALAAAWLLVRLAGRSALVDAVLAKVPLLGKARRAVAMERFTQVFSIFLQAGRTMS